ncbi:hypothetical protein ABT117_22735 [Streptomyces sp. NPDC002262]|uniref:hypothetical protein n=1 Tax=Streptomyces sp. NPDC002262 TaxID=3154414 RepID=UPI00331AC307
MTSHLAHQHTTAGWATAFADAFRATAASTAVPAAGRRLADEGAAGPVTVGDGFASTTIRRPDGTSLRARLLVPVLTERQWDAVYAAIAADPRVRDAAAPGNVTDLLTDPAYTGGIPLVPSPADFRFDCGCGERVLCAHTAALGHLLADRARTAPGLLFALRGRGHGKLRAHLRAHPRVPPRVGAPGSAPRDTRTDSPVGPAPGARSPVPDGSVRTTALPPPPAVDTDGTTSVWEAVTDDPPAALPDLAALRSLVRDAARRAAALLQGHAPPALDTATDIARFTAEGDGAHLATAAAHLGLTPPQMRDLAAAYRHGGPPGVAAHLTPGDADPAVLADAEAAIQPLRPAPRAPVERRGNELTDPSAGVRLRHGPDGRWYPYVGRHGDWQPAAAPSRDPATAYKEARLAARTLR